MPDEKKCQNEIQSIIERRPRGKSIVILFAILAVALTCFFIGYYIGKGPAERVGEKGLSASSMQQLEGQLSIRFADIAGFVGLRAINITDDKAEVSLWLKPPAAASLAWETEMTRKITDAALAAVVEEMRELDIDPAQLGRVMVTAYSYSLLEGGALAEDGHCLLGMSLCLDGVPVGFYSGQDLKELRKDSEL